MKMLTLSKFAIAASFVLGLTVGTAVNVQPGYADSSDDPCEGLRGRKRRKCEAENNRADRELYLAGHALAKAGKYKASLRLFNAIQNQDTPAVQTYIGYSMRKLGHFDAALVYYKKALKIEPNLSLTRSYLGQAYLQIGFPAKAAAQLAEIATRCGTSCDGYATLKNAITAYRVEHS